ncbi:exported hypothetical protein [Mesorhizobium sp. ORS 3324]|nr:exported hypothetical protein [Mesorhizobium sp. ORS 3324]
MSIHQPRRTPSLLAGAAELSIAAEDGSAAAIPPRLRLQSPSGQFYLDFGCEIEAVFETAQTFQETPAIEFALSRA